MKFPSQPSILFILITQTSLTAFAEENSDVEEMIIEGRKSDYSVITENAQKIIDVPGSLGDPLMAVFSLPGVLSEGDGGGAPAVRGSSPSDNLYLIDGAPAGYVFHEFSTSIFNENVIQDFELFSAGFGPAYSNAIGGVFDIKLRDPKSQDIKTKIDFSLLRAGVFVEGDVTEHSAFYFSGRNGLIHYFFDEESAEEDGIRVQNAPEDRDYQFKYQYRLDDHKFTLGANGASDLAAAEFTEQSREVLEEPDFAGDAQLKNSFNNQNLRWQWTSDVGSNLDVQIGHYKKREDTFWGGDKYFFDFNTEDTYAIAKYHWVINNRHLFSVGAETHQKEFQYDARFIQYVCTEFDPDCALRRGELIVSDDKVDIRDQNIFINDHWIVTERFNLDLGVQRNYNDFTDETFTHPRLAASWEFIDTWTLTSAAGSYNRLPDIDKTFPEIGNQELKSPKSNHYTLGLKHELQNGWSWSVTAYHKTMDQLPLAMGINDPNLYTNNVEGEAQGVDLFINKDLIDRWYGWLAISASTSTRTNKITQQEQDYYLDTPWVINWVMNYQINERWTAGGRLTLQSGRAITPIIGAQENPYFENHILPIYGEPYSDRLPTYARLDLRFQRDMTLWGLAGTYNIDILNVLNRQNVTDRNLDYIRSSSPQDYELEDEVGMGIIPSIGFSLTF
jgi:outer membrane cobalamin receptor